MHRSFAFVLAGLLLGGCGASGRTHVTTVERVVYVEGPARACDCEKPRAHGHAQRERRPQFRSPRQHSQERRKPRYERQRSRELHSAKRVERAQRD